MSRSLFARLQHRFGPPVTSADRRAFLRASLAASAGLLLSGCHRDGSGPAGVASRRGSVAGGRGKHVVIVGGGFSGLACAHELQAVGYRVTVFEAQRTLGGRVRSLKGWVPGRNVEAGGEFIGSNHPLWVAYADKFGLKFLDTAEAETVEKAEPGEPVMGEAASDAAAPEPELHAPILLQGQALSEADAEKLWEELDEALARMNDDARTVDEDEPWKTPRAAEWDRRTVAEWIAEQPVSDRCKAALTAQLSGDNAVPTDRQSYLGMLTQVKGGGVEKYWTESEVYRCKGGNQQLAYKLADAIGRRNIRLGAEVASIELHADRAWVRCGDGRVEEADEVVLSVPPSVWQKINLTPALPADLRPQMGEAAKYLAALRTRFWKEKGLAPDSLSDGPITLTWEATDHQEGDANAVLTAFIAKNVGEAGRIEPAARARYYDAELERVYPGYAENVKDRRFIHWPSDPHTLAAYSFPAPGQVTTVGPRLRAGLADAGGRTRLHFAGEHACYKFVGYMEGALQSGAAAARRIAGAEKPAAADRRTAVRWLAAAAMG